MKKHFNKNFVMNKKDNEDFEKSSKCWICDNYYSRRSHSHITEKYCGSVHK